MIPPIHPNDAGRVRCCVDGCGSYGNEAVYISTQDGGAFPAPDSPRYCDGPACMGWRWMRPPDQTYIYAKPTQIKEGPEPPRPSEISAGWKWCPGNGDLPAHWEEPVEEAMVRRAGYCGRAGE